MNIALLSGSFLPTLGGAEIVVDALASEYVKKGHKVAIFTDTIMTDKTYDHALQYDVYRFPFNPKYLSFQRRVIEEFRKCISEFNPDIIHSFLCGCCDWIGLKYGKKHRIPTFFTAQTNWKYIYNQRSPFKENSILNKLFVNAILNNGPTKFIKCADYITSVCKSVVDSQVDVWGNRIKDTVIIYNGYNKELMLNKTVKKKANMNIDDDNMFKLCYAGRISDEKNLLFSFRVCEELKKKNKIFVFYLAGTGEIEKYKELAHNLNIADNVRFLGRLDLNELSFLYKKSDVFLFPSVFDCDSIACIESRLCGCPTLCIKNTGTSERIIDGQNGWALEEKVEAFVDKIVDLMTFKNSDSFFLLNIKNTTAVTVVDTWDTVSNKYLSLYQNVHIQYNTEGNI